MKLYPINRIILVFILFLSSGLSQFSEVNVAVDTRILRGSTDDNLVQSLKEQVESYFLTTQFSPEALDLGLVINIQLVIESIKISGNQKLVNGQALFSNFGDQKYFARGFEFQYDIGVSMIYSPMYDPLTSFFDYYAYLFIAGELDTYGEFGGNLYYSKAIDLSSDGRSSAYSRGWETRQKRAKEIKDNLELRRAKFYFFQAFDIASAPKVKNADLKKPLKKFYINLERSIGNEGINRYTEPFLKVWAKDIAAMLKAVKMTDEIKSLMEMDSKNKTVYESVLTEKK